MFSINRVAIAEIFNGKITPPHNLLIRKEKNVTKELENGFALSGNIYNTNSMLSRRSSGKKMRSV